MNRITVLLTVAALVALPPTATMAAAPPPDIASPLVAFPDNEGVAIKKALACPDGTPVPLAVKVVFGSAVRSTTLQDPCEGYWSDGPSDPDESFYLDSQIGYDYDLDSDSDLGEPDLTGVTIKPTWSKEKDHTGLISVVDPSGRAIARRAVTISVLAGGRIEQGSDAFVNVCLDGSHTVRSEDGVLGCYVGTSYLFDKGWPKPPPVRSAPRLSQKAATTYAKRAINKRFRYRKAPAARRVSCKPLSRTTQSCQASWRTARYRYSGKVRIFTVLVRGDAEWHYTMDLRRTDRRTGKSRSIRVS